MKTILCINNENPRGSYKWSDMLQDKLIGQYQIVERDCRKTDITANHFKGITSVDLVIVSPCANDMLLLGHSVAQIAKRCGFLMQFIKSKMLAQNILLLSPPFKDNQSSHFEAVAKFLNVHFLDITKIAKPSDYDSICLDEKENEELANKLSEKIKDIYK
jgi:hypothetical protein